MKHHLLLILAVCLLSGCSEEKPVLTNEVVTFDASQISWFKYRITTDGISYRLEYWELGSEWWPIIHASSLEEARAYKKLAEEASKTPPREWRPIE